MGTLGLSKKCRLIRVAERSISRGAIQRQLDVDGHIEDRFWKASGGSAHPVHP